MKQIIIIALLNCMVVGGQSLPETSRTSKHTGVPAHELSQAESSDIDLFSIGRVFAEEDKPSRSSEFSIPRSYHNDQGAMQKYQQAWESFLHSSRTMDVPKYNPSRIDLIR